MKDAQNEVKFDWFKTYNHTPFFLHKSDNWIALLRAKAQRSDFRVIYVVNNLEREHTFKCVNIYECAKLYHVRINIGSWTYHVQGYKALKHRCRNRLMYYFFRKRKKRGIYSIICDIYYRA